MYVICKTKFIMQFQLNWKWKKYLKLLLPNSKHDFEQQTTKFNSKQLINIT